MKSKEEIKSQIQKHLDFIDKIDFKNNVFASIMEAGSMSWINALKWVLEDEEE